MADKHIMETVVKLAGAVDPSLGKATKNASKALGGLDMKAVGMKVAFAGAAVIAVKAIADITKGLYDLGSEFDKAYDSIRIGTGATGEQLEGLKSTFKDVYGSVPGSMEDASKAVADYNTKLNLSGKELEGMSKKAILASQLLDEDLNSTIENSSKVFQAWGVDAKDMENEMDYMFKVSQSTGMGMNNLMTSLQQYGPQLKTLGYNFEQSAAMIGQMEKAGLRTDEVMAAMKKSVGVFAAEGLDASKGLRVYADAIKNAKTETEAIQIASEVFGKKAGSTMANAIRSGAMAIDDLTASLQSSGESIDKAFWDTADAAEKMEILQHQFQNAIEPLASALFDSVADIMPEIIEIFNQLAPVIKDVAAVAAPMVKNIFGVFGKILSKLAPLFAQLAKAIYPLIDVLISELLPPLMEIIEALLPSLIELVTALTPVIVLLAQAFSAGLAGAIRTLAPIIVSIIKVLSNLIDFVVNVFTGKWKDAWHSLVEAVKNLFKGLADILLAPFKVVSNAVDAIKGKIGKNKSDKGGKDVPKLAKGGFTNGVSIAGEAGREAVISFDPAYRSDNISTWLKAGQMLGVSGSGSSNSYNLGGVTFSPNLYFTQKMSDDEVVQAIERSGGEFMDMLEDRIAQLSGVKYGAVSNMY